MLECSSALCYRGSAQTFQFLDCSCQGQSSPLPSSMCGRCWRPHTGFILFLLWPQQCLSQLIRLLLLLPCKPIVDSTTSTDPGLWEPSIPPLAAGPHQPPALARPGDPSLSTDFPASPSPVSSWPCTDVSHFSSYWMFFGFVFWVWALTDSWGK